jgi:hypothetical protein
LALSEVNSGILGEQPGQAEQSFDSESSPSQTGEKPGALKRPLARSPAQTGNERPRSPVS